MPLVVRSWELPSRVCLPCQNEHAAKGSENHGRLRAGSSQEQGSSDVTRSFARASRSETDAGMPLATGVIGASAVMCLRVLIASAVLNPSVSIGLVRYLIAPFFVAAFIAWWGIRKHKGA